VHLGFNKGLLDTELSDVFMNAGAKCVSGYSAATNAIYDGKVLAEMAKVMLVNDDKHTVTDANSAITAASLGSDTFYHHFTTLTGTKFKYNIMQVTTRFVLDANHPNSNAQLKWWKDEETDTPPPASGGGNHPHIVGGSIEYRSDGYWYVTITTGNPQQKYIQDIWGTFEFTYVEGATGETKTESRPLDFDGLSGGRVEIVQSGGFNDSDTPTCTWRLASGMNRSLVSAKARINGYSTYEGLGMGNTRVTIPDNERIVAEIALP
jgi:hypothetical protein